MQIAGMMASVEQQVETSGNYTLLIALLTIIFTSPFLLYFAQRLLYFFERKFKYPSWIAVFLSNEQVYFGKLTKLTKEDLRIEDIYYLSVQELEKDLSLTKLGEELHGPKDFMLINRSHVTFLESLKEEGQVVRAIKEYKNKA